MAQGYSGDTAKALGLLEDLKGIIVKQENTIRVQQLKVELLSSRARELEAERDVLRRRVDELSRELRSGRTRSQFSTFKPYPRSRPSIEDGETPPTFLTPVFPLKYFGPLLTDLAPLPTLPFCLFPKVCL
uniref:Uncharacterized protein n=1 Tax=Branchiostoma floridae TaxID=7739 RepID=C3XT98_BRAFL|eukprot:XP_002612678.1 hypothetical protein BRAFLDRAFT_106697 [Branchiostoma floridae]